MNDEDYESKTSVVSGYIVREYCEVPSNFRCEGDIDGFLKKHNIIGLFGIDTRRLTRIIRETGVMQPKLLPVNTVPSASIRYAVFALLAFKSI